MPRALVPLSVADQLPALVDRLTARLESEALEQIVSVGRTASAFPLRTLVSIALADVEHCFQVSEESGRDLPRSRWEALLVELHRIDAQVEHLLRPTRCDFSAGEFRGGGP